MRELQQTPYLAVILEKQLPGKVMTKRVVRNRWWPRLRWWVSIKAHVCTARIKNHELTDCSHFACLPHQEKMSIIHSLALCFACLKQGHRSSNCKRRVRCAICDSRHPTSLHLDRTGEDREQTSLGAQSATSCRTRSKPCSTCVQQLYKEHGWSSVETAQHAPSWFQGVGVSAVKSEGLPNLYARIVTRLWFQFGTLNSWPWR